MMGAMPEQFMAAVEAALSILVPLYLPLQIYTAVAWKQAWRWTSLLPALVLLLILISIIPSLAAGSNLAPIYIFLALPLASLYLLTLMAIRFFVNRKKK